MDFTLRFYDASCMTLVHECSYEESFSFAIQDLHDIVKSVFDVFQVSVDFLVCIDKESKLKDMDLVFNVIVSCPVLSVSLFNDIMFMIKKVVECRYLNRF